MPYAWVNPRHGVRPGETTETNVAAVGSFTLEFGVLSRLTGDARFETASKRAVRALWSMRDPGLDLLGNTLDVRRGTWTSRSGGIGAGCDSFFEYLLKAHVVLGDAEYLDIFNDAYVAAMRHYHDDGWYHEANLHTGAPTHLQATSLQAFWPGMQTLFGDVEAANRTHARFASVWRRFGMFPERFMYRDNKVHASEKYYPLRPEFAESSAMLWFATRDDRFRHAGRRIAEDINKHTRAPHGHASVRDVQRKKLEDHQPSFFLAETCKYLYLLFDETSWRRETSRRSAQRGTRCPSSSRATTRESRRTTTGKRALENGVHLARVRGDGSGGRRGGVRPASPPPEPRGFARSRRPGARREMGRRRREPPRRGAVA